MTGNNGWRKALLLIVVCGMPVFGTGCILTSLLGNLGGAAGGGGLLGAGELGGGPLSGAVASTPFTGPAFDPTARIPIAPATPSTPEIDSTARTPVTPPTSSTPAAEPTDRSAGGEATPATPATPSTPETPSTPVAPVGPIASGPVRQPGTLTMPLPGFTNPFDPTGQCSSSG